MSAEHLLELEAALGVLQGSSPASQERAGRSSASARSMSTNFSPKSVLARMRAMASVGHLLAVLDAQRDAGLAVDELDAPHRADVDAADLHVGAREEALAGGVEACRRAGSRRRRRRRRPSRRSVMADDEQQEGDGAREHVLAAVGDGAHRLPGEAHGVAAAPEDERQHEVEDDDAHDRQADGPAHGHAHAGRPAAWRSSRSSSGSAPRRRRRRTP